LDRNILHEELGRQPLLIQFAALADHFVTAEQLEEMLHCLAFSAWTTLFGGGRTDTRGLIYTTS